MVRRRLPRSTNLRTLVKNYRLLRRITKKHPLATLATATGAAGGFGIDHWIIDASNQTQLIISGVLALLVVIAKHLLGIGYGAIYVYPGYHPLTGQYWCVYVGKTRQHGDRHHQHMGTSTRYPGPPAPWSDTIHDPRGPVYKFESRWVTNFGLDRRERKWIRYYLPLYNDKMNDNNPHRIPRQLAQQLRAQRDAGIYTREYVQNVPRRLLPAGVVQ